MNTLGLFQKDNRLSDEGIAALLSERLERDFSAEQIAKMKGRARTPKYVAEALGIEREQPDKTAADPNSSSRIPDPPPAPLWPDDESPNEPDRATGVALEPAEPFDFDAAETRLMLVEAYRVAGKGAAYVGKNDQYERAFDLHAERCADAWLSLARRDARVAKALASLTSGGAWGQLLLIHLSLVLSVLAASGKIDVQIPAAPGVDNLNVNVNGDGPASPAEHETRAA